MGELKLLKPDAVMFAYLYKGIHWKTHFESLDGFTVDASSGTITVDGYGVTLDTGAVNNSSPYIYKIHASGFNPVAPTWDKPRRFKVKVRINQSTKQTIDIVCGGAGAGQLIGFYIVNNNLYAIVDAQGTYHHILVKTIVDGEELLLEAIWTPKKGTVFYVNGILVATITDLLPSGEPDADGMIFISIITSENVSKTMTLGSWEFLQQP